jgi:mRNA-degrading endonuclease RelE of RelBE toxin-antitoxin system
MSGTQKSVIWAPEAQDQLRANRNRTTHPAWRRQLSHEWNRGREETSTSAEELRLRVGDYRVFFYQVAPQAIKIIGVKHRSQAYR